MNVAPNPEPVSASDVARKTAKGALALGMRQLLVQACNVLGCVSLARLLTAVRFGSSGTGTARVGVLALAWVFTYYMSLLDWDPESVRRGFRNVGSTGHAGCEAGC